MSANVPQRGVRFFGDDQLRFFSGAEAKLGRKNSALFFMPSEDGAKLSSIAQVARESGYPRSIRDVYLEGRVAYGIDFPLSGKSVRIPTSADAGGFPHYLAGGRTAVHGPAGSNSFYLVNNTREFVINGGDAVPEGSYLFKLDKSGRRTVLRKF